MKWAKKKHELSDIDTVGRTAFCSHCNQYMRINHRVTRTSDYWTCTTIKLKREGAVIPRGKYRTELRAPKTSPVIEEVDVKTGRKITLKKSHSDHEMSIDTANRRIADSFVIDPSITRKKRIRIEEEVGEWYRKLSLRIASRDSAPNVWFNPHKELSKEARELIINRYSINNSETASNWVADQYR